LDPGFGLLYYTQNARQNPAVFDIRLSAQERSHTQSLHPVKSIHVMNNFLVFNNRKSSDFLHCSTWGSRVVQAESSKSPIGLRVNFTRNAENVLTISRYRLDYYTRINGATKI
jgi:hypothetical protein